jgi:hypothetical protein
MRFALRGKAEGIGPSRRRHERVPVSFAAPTRSVRHPDTQMAICNLSCGGFMGRCAIDFPDGTELFLHVPRIGWRLATVRWSQNGLIGGKFVYSIIVENALGDRGTE